MLTYHKTNKEEFYKIELTLKDRFWTTDAEIQEYNEFFKTPIWNHWWWKFHDEEEAKSKYTWAVLRWDNGR